MVKSRLRFQPGVLLFHFFQCRLHFIDPVALLCYFIFAFVPFSFGTQGEFLHPCQPLHEGCHFLLVFFLQIIKDLKPVPGVGLQVPADLGQLFFRLQDPAFQCLDLLPVHLLQVLVFFLDLNASSSAMAAFRRHCRVFFSKKGMCTAAVLLVSAVLKKNLFRNNREAR